MGSRLVISGVGEDLFAPDKAITRAEFASIVVKGLGLMRTGTGTDAFKDVKKGEWYYDAVSIANRYELISGTGNGSYEPGRQITREEAKIIMNRAMDLTKMNTAISKEEIMSVLGHYKDS